jgi:dethiobiotin synthetase
MSTLFVTATGTDIGKTYVTALLVRTLREKGFPVRALKPVISGFDPETAATSDSAILLEAMGENVSEETLAAISPWRYAASLAPNMAARLEDRMVDFNAIVSWSKVQSGPVIIEGVGGIMSPISDDRTGLDWMVGLASPALLIGGSYLGALSHTLSAVAAMRARGIRIAGIVVNESEAGSIGLEETAEALKPFVAGLPLVMLSRGLGDGPAAKQIRLDQVADLHAVALQCLAD